MKRFHVHLSVPDLASSIRFYSGMFGAAPGVVKSDYAKWMLDEPRVNFAISQRGGQPGLNHLGLQAESPEELAEIRTAFDAAQLGAVVDESGARCCYAVSDKHWVVDPQGIAWEAFHTLDTIPVFAGVAGGVASAGCCEPAGAVAGAACCEPATAGTTAPPAARACCGSAAEMPRTGDMPAARSCCA